MKDIDIIVISGEFCSVDPNRFELAKQRPRKMMHEVTSIRGPISNVLVVHKENEGHDNLAKDASSTSCRHSLIINERVRDDQVVDHEAQRILHAIHDTNHL